MKSSTGPNDLVDKAAKRGVPVTLTNTLNLFIINTSTLEAVLRRLDAAEPKKKKGKKK